MSNARGWTLANTPAKEGGDRVVMIGRQACCEILRNKVPSEVIIRRKVIDVKLAEGNNKPALVFQDGETEAFDVVVACDGIWSRTRRAMFSVQDSDRYEFSPQYEGLVGVGGFVPSSKIEGTPDGEMNVALGANGFFGYGYTTGNPQDASKAGDMATWWSTYTLNNCPDDWRNINKEEVKKELQVSSRKFLFPNMSYFEKTTRSQSFPRWLMPAPEISGSVYHGRPETMFADSTFV